MAEKKRGFIYKFFKGKKIGGIRKRGELPPELGAGEKPKKKPKK